MQDPMFYVIAGVLVLVFLKVMSIKGGRQEKQPEPVKKNSTRRPSKATGPRDWEPVDPKKVRFR